MQRATTCAAALLAAGLAAPVVAAPACTAEAFVPSLDVLDAGQLPRQGGMLRDVFLPGARIAVEWDGSVRERSLDEFIAEVAELRVPRLAYASLAPAIACTARDRATLTRRGCFVGRQPDLPLVEVTQAETMQLFLTPAGWRIAKLHTVAEAARLDGRLAFEQRPFLDLPECVRAAEEAAAR